MCLEMLAELLFKRGVGRELSSITVQQSSRLHGGDSTTFVHSIEAPKIVYYPCTGEAVLDTVTSWDKADLIASPSLLKTSFYVVIYKFVMQIPDIP